MVEGGKEKMLALSLKILMESEKFLRRQQLKKKCSSEAPEDV